MLPSCEPCHKGNDSYEGFSLPEEEKIEFSHQEMLAYIQYVLKYSKVQPRTYWTEFPFYIIINSHKQQFRMGTRPEDLACIDRIVQKSLKRHHAYLSRLERFPLDKAEYYLRLKETHAVNTVRGLSKITGEDWSYIARILRVTALASPIKKFLQSNKENPAGGIGDYPSEVDAGRENRQLVFWIKRGGHYCFGCRFGFVPGCHFGLAG